MTDLGAAAGRGDVADFGAADEPAPSGLMDGIRRRHQRHRRRFMTGSVAVVAALGLAGLGLAGVLPTVLHQPAGLSGTRLGSSSSAGPVAVTGARARALALAQRLVAEVAVPPGTRTAHPAQVPQAVGNTFVPTDTSAVADRMYLASQRMDTVDAFMRAHAPEGMRNWGTGQLRGPGGVEAEDVDWAVSSPPAGIYSAYVDIAIGPQSGGTALIGVYAGVTWIPARSAVEHIDPRRYQRVVMTAVEYGQRTHRVTRAFGPAVVARLAGYLNGLSAEPDLLRSCPAAMATYRLTFTGPGIPDVVVSAAGCLDDGVTVGGKAQPALDDQSNTLAARAGKLLNINSTNVG